MSNGRPEDAGTAPAGPTSAKLAALYDGFKAKFSEVPEITVRELQSWMEERQAEPVLVDVRTAAEQQVSMLPGPATMTQREFERRGPESFRGRKIVCYCTAGYRSGMYALKLRRDHGLDAFNLRGSILAWTQAGLPLADPRDGSVTTRVHVFSKDWALQGDGYTPVVFQRPILRLAQDAVGGWAQSLVRVVTGRGRGRDGGGSAEYKEGKSNGGEEGG